MSRTAKVGHDPPLAELTIFSSDYYVQQYTVEQNGEEIVKTNGYKSGSIKKIVQILESVLFNKSIECPYKGLITNPPPVFAG